MSEETSSQDRALLPQGFLRGLEADLRALCADARRRNPEVKEAAERVILLLKEADNTDAEREAADEAASAFCAACETLDPRAVSTALSLQIKVALRAVSCLHKLLAHRALSVSRLPEVLNALQRLGSPSLDDNLTLKVLQGVLSLLTVRSYAKALSEDELSRAFSLLFILRTSRSGAAGNAASNALSAISQMSGMSDGGVIEQTSKAAFRQVSSDLFASAADSAVRIAVEKQAPTGAPISLEEFPSEVRAAYSLFTDLCRAASNEELSWISNRDPSSATHMTGLDLSLALEVLDDGLASNIALFGGQQIFAEMLTSRICPMLHTLLRIVEDRATVKSLLGLVVTLNRNYWRLLKSDSEALLYALAKIVKEGESSEGKEVSWAMVFAMESLRCIFKSNVSEPNNLIDFVMAFDLGEASGKLISSIVNIACDTMGMVDTVDVRTIPPAPISGTMKPFANTISNTPEFLVALATGMYLEVVKAAGDAANSNRSNMTSVLLTTDTTERAITLLGKLIWDLLPGLGSEFSRSDKQSSLDALKAIASSLGQLAVTATNCGLESIREKSLATLCAACKNAAQSRAPSGSSDRTGIARVTIVYDVLFRVYDDCRESLGRSWLLVIEALEQLDSLLRTHVGSGESPSIVSLRSRLELVVSSTSKMTWGSCHDMISAMVQCSRTSIATVSKRLTLADQPKPDANQDIRIFGMATAETALLGSFKRDNKDSDGIPASLWQLLTGHLTSVCTDSMIFSLRRAALSSLTRLACGAIPSGDPPFVSHDKIMRPFLDLFTASHFDVRSGSLSAVFTVLEAEGERLHGEAAWFAVLDILSTAAGSRAAKMESPTSEESRVHAQGPGASPPPGIEMMSEAFKVVQVISDDFLTSLSMTVLPKWIDVLRLYCCQNEDVNVALTAIGLLWRTADFLAKGTSPDSENELWVQLFETLKEISTDERPEIRNSAVKTLTGTLSAHSMRLSAIAWNGCVARALLPLLEEVMQGGGSMPSDEGGMVGKGRGDVQLLLHHSRDTPRKQWNETRVLALAGVAKVLRTAMPRLSVLHDESGRPLFVMLTDGGADGVWRKMLRAAGVAAGSRDREVAVAGVSALLELLSAAGYVVGDRRDGDSPTRANLEGSRSAPAALGEQKPTSWIAGVIGSAEAPEPAVSNGTDNGVDDEQRARSQSAVVMWEAVWTSLNEAIGGQGGKTEPGTENQSADGLKIVDQRALQMLAEGLLESRTSLAGKFTSGSSRMLVEVLMHLALGRGVSESKHSDSTAHLSDVQEATLKGLEKLSFGSDNESWVGLVQGLLFAVEEQRKGARQSMLLARRVLVILGRLYGSEELPNAVKVSELPRLLQVVGKIMVLRNRMDGVSGRNVRTRLANGTAEQGSSALEVQQPLWVEATEVVLNAIRCQMKATRQPQGEAVWKEFAVLAEEFMYSGHRSRRVYEVGGNSWEKDGAEDYDIQVTGCVQDALSQGGSGMSQETKGRLVGLLSRGAEEGKGSVRPRFVRSCQKRLFQLADGVRASRGGQGQGVGAGDIADESNKRVVETCGRVLGQFIADGQRAGRCPLPATRRAEAVFLLQQLRKLNSYDGDAAHGFSKKHLVTLYPRLCECVDSRDEAVRQLARELLDEAAPGARDPVQKGIRGTGVLA